MMNDETRLEMSREEVLSCAGATKTLPMLNGMMNEVFGLMEDPNSSFSQLFRVVRYDQAISSKIISIANSAYYSRGASVTNLERAMIVVGLEEIKRIIMCLVFMKGMTAQWNLEQNDIALMWGHSLTVAHAAKTLSTKMIVEEPGTAFTVSILHEWESHLLHVWRTLQKDNGRGAPWRDRMCANSSAPSSASTIRKWATTCR